MRVRLILALAAMAATPVLAHAGVYKDSGCQVTVPDGWVASKTRIASPDKKQWASLLSDPDGAAHAVMIESSLKAEKVSEDGKMVLMVSSASFGGLTNKQYHAITKSSPACIADVTVPAGQEAAAQAIAKTAAPAK